MLTTMTQPLTPMNIPKTLLATLSPVAFNACRAGEIAVIIGASARYTPEVMNLSAWDIREISPAIAFVELAYHAPIVPGAVLAIMRESYPHDPPVLPDIPLLVAIMETAKTILDAHAALIGPLRFCD